MRIAKAIAHAGLCSRRDAEAWIAAGRVAVNGKLLTTPAHVVSPDDKITVDEIELRLDEIEGIVISPGPCTPAQAGIGRGEEEILV